VERAEGVLAMAVQLVVVAGLVVLALNIPATEAFRSVS
jgi:hypothetical protein